MNEDIIQMAQNDVNHWASELVSNYRTWGTSHIELDVEVLERALDRLHRRSREHFEKVLQRGKELTADTAV